MDDKTIEQLLKFVEEAAKESDLKKRKSPPKTFLDNSSPIISKFIEEFRLTAGPYKVKNYVLSYLYKEVFVPKYSEMMRLKERHFFQLLSKRLPKGRYNATRYYLLNHPFKDEHEKAKK